MRTGYQATVFRYGFIYDMLFILPDGDALLVNGSDGEQQTHVFHDPERHTLQIGRYGKFDRDHEQHRRTPSDPIEYEGDFDLEMFSSGNEMEKPKKNGRKPKTDKKE